MRKPLLTPLACVAVLFLALTTGCKTCPDPPEFVLAPDLSPPVLQNPEPPAEEISQELDDYLRQLDRDIVSLVGQDLRWRMRMASARLIIGEISAEEYAETIEDLMNRLGGLPNE